MKLGYPESHLDMIGSIVLVLWDQYGLGNPDALGTVSNSGDTQCDCLRTILGMTSDLPEHRHTDLYKHSN
jgi:hypothetical protein